MCIESFAFACLYHVLSNAQVEHCAHIVVYLDRYMFYAWTYCVNTTLSLVVSVRIMHVPARTKYAQKVIRENKKILLINEHKRLLRESRYIEKYDLQWQQ